MRLSQLHEGFSGFGGLDGLAQNVGGANGMFNKQQDPGRPEHAGDKQDKPKGTDKGAMPQQPRRSGNQNAHVKDRHKGLMNPPKDGDSLESGSEQNREEDGILVPGQTIRTERPVPNRLGRPGS